MTKTAVALVSGGMDSVTLLYHLIDQGYKVIMMSFDYGQRHAKMEISAAKYFAFKTGSLHLVAPFNYLQAYLGGSALTDNSVPVPHGYYAEENMRKTVVPNRNMIMLSIAAAVAVSQKAELLATGVHAGDHYIYPDCRPPFIAALEQAIRWGNEGHIHPAFQLYTPYLNVTKVEIVQEGTRLGVPYDLTYTCYEGGDRHCGLCGSCQERRAAFIAAGIEDYTPYDNLTIFEAK